MLADLYREHYTSLVRMAMVLLDEQGQAEEVVQDAFVRMHGAWGRLRDEDAAVPYLRSTVMNLTRSHMRRLRVARRHVAVPVGASASAEAVAVVAESRREVLGALRGLPARQREALVLRYYLDLTDTEVATSMGVSLGSAKTHLRRGLASLTRTLESQS